MRTTAAAITTGPSDAQLLARLRGGDEDAYSTLYERHVGAATRLARSILNGDPEAEDATSEAFAAVLVAVRRGNGPTDSFRPYLLTCVRNECTRSARRRARAGVADPGRFDDPETAASEPDDSADIVERNVIATAFANLPRRYRAVLWQTAVRGHTHAEVARAEGVSTAGVATLAMRARRALSISYLDTHVGSLRSLPRGCREVRSHLADLVRGTAPARWIRRIEDHTVVCADCCRVRAELVDLDRALAGGRLGRTLRSGALPPPALLGLLGRLEAWLFVAGPPLATAATLAVAAVNGQAIIPADEPTTEHPAPANRVAPAGAIRIAPLDPPASTVLAPVVSPTTAPPPSPTTVADRTPTGDRPTRPVTGGAVPRASAPPPTPTVDPPPSTVPSDDPADDPGDDPGDDGEDPDQPVDVVDPIVEDVVDPIVEDVVDPIVEDVVDPIVEDVVDPIVEDVVDPIVEDVVDPIVEDVVDPIVEDVVDPILDPILDPIVEDVVDPILDPILDVTDVGLLGP